MNMINQKDQFMYLINFLLGNYKSKQLLGKIFDSKYKIYEGFSMGSRNNVKDSRHNYSGPFSYIIPSEFGIYKSKDADNYP